MIASGTDSRMMNGSVRLSYWPASVRYTRSRPRPKIAADWEPARTSSNETPDHAYENPCGSTRFDSSDIFCSASPELNPGAAEPLIVAERNRLKWLMLFGAVASLTATMLLSGVIRPVLVRTWYFEMSAGFDRNC